MLQIVDETIAFQLDSALAVQAKREEDIEHYETLDLLMERLEANIDLIIKVWGGKIKRPKKKKKQEKEAEPTLQQVTTEAMRKKFKLVRKSKDELKEDV